MNRKTMLRFALGPVGGGVLGILTVPLVAWFFPAEDVGRLYMLQTVVALSTIVAFVGLDQSYVREFHEVDDRAALLRTTFVPALAFIFVLLLVSLGSVGDLSFLLYGVQDTAYYWLTLACIAAAILARPLALVLRMHERALSYSLGQLLPKVVFVLLVLAIGIFVAQSNFIWLSTALLIGSCSVLIVYVWLTRSAWIPALRSGVLKGRFRHLVWFGLPLAFASLAYWGLSGTSAFVLRGSSDLDQVGIYSVAMSVAGVGAVFQAFFTTIWGPIVYRWVADKEDMGRVDDIARQALAVIVVLLTCCGLFSWVLDLVLPAPYSDVKYLLLCTIIQPLIYTLTEITGIGIAVTRRTIFSLWSTLAALLVNLSLNLLWTPALGAAGAVMSNALSFLVYFYCRTESSSRLWRSFPRTRLYVTVTVGVLISVASVAAGETFRAAVVAAWACYGALFLFLLRDDVRSLYARIRGSSL